MSPVQPECSFATVSAAQTRLLGQTLASFLRVGDLVILSGELGAGKTTFTQGIGVGLAVAQRVTSPTFIIARTHLAQQEGHPNLVHVDAYRLQGADDIESLDLESSLENSVVVVEWGDGKVEHLASRVLQVRLSRLEDYSSGGANGAEEIPQDTPCQIQLLPISGHWNLSKLDSAWNRRRGGYRD